VVFLMEYDRSSGRLVSFQTYLDANKQDANQARLALEIELNRKCIQHEVVLLEAENEAAIRKTHARYFEDLAELVDST
jgi:hypothetical protein